MLLERAADSIHELAGLVHDLTEQFREVLLAAFGDSQDLVTAFLRLLNVFVVLQVVDGFLHTLPVPAQVVLEFAHLVLSLGDQPHHDQLVLLGFV